MDHNQNKTAEPEPAYQANTPPPQVTGEPSAQTAPIPNPPPGPKKRGLPKVLLVVVLAIIALGGPAYLLLGRNKPAVTEPEFDPYTEHVFEEFPDFPGIPISENTISFVKSDGKFCILYKGVVYLPQDSGVLIPKKEEATAEMLAFPWIGLVDAPNDLVPGGADEVFSFKDSPSNNSFVFIMRWQTQEGERYHMYRFFNNNFSELKVFTRDDGLHYVPKLNIFSLGGNFLNLSMFTCANCLTEQPETVLYYIPTGDTRNIGKVSFFEWSEDDNVYKYKEYEEGVNPDDLPLRTNEFFETSEELLNPT